MNDYRARALRPLVRLVVSLCVLTAALHVAATEAADAAKPARKDYYGDPLPPGVLARMGSVQLRQYDADLAFSADGKTLISGHMDVRFWDVASGRQVRRTRLEKTRGVELEARIAGLSPDGSMAAAFLGDSLHLFDTTTAAELRRLPAEGMGFWKIAFSADGKRLAWFVGVLDNYAIHVWDLTAGVERLALKRAKQVEAIALSADGKLLAFRDNNRVFHLWDTAKGRELEKGPLEGDAWALSPKGETIATADVKGRVTLWETAGLKKLATLQPAPGVTGGILQDPHPFFSPNGKLLAVAGIDPLIVWDVPARKERLRLPDATAQKLAFSPDGKILACAGWFDIRLWDMATGEPLHYSRPGHDGAVHSVAVSPDGRTVASVGGDGRSVRLWDADTGKPRAQSLTNNSWIRSVAFAPDGRLLISGSDGVIRLLASDTGAERRRFIIKDFEDGRQSQQVLVCQLSPEDERLAAMSWGWDKAGKSQRSQITVWDAHTGDLLGRRRFQGRLDSRFTPDGASVSVASRERLVFEDTLTGEERAAIPGDLGDPVAFSRDGQLVAVGIHKTEDGPPGAPSGYTPLGLRLAEVATGEEIFHVDGRIEFAAISPNGRVVVTADADALRVWDMRTGETLLRRAWPDGFPRRPRWTAIDSLAFRPDSRAVVTGMNDGTILVWDLTPESGPKTAARELGRKELAALWSDLAGSARKAHRAIYTLAASSEQALPFLADYLRPVVAVDGKRVEKLLTDLDSEQFAVRDAAARELTAWGEQVDQALRRVLENKPSLEVRNRVRSIREALRSAPPAATLRTLRAIRALEAVGTPEARRLLRMLAGGAAEARETREARKALERVKQ